ncbi:hypothetical protein [Halococcus agarilyticus]|uniref:hypothetical protein n=1 Tax=Halococcus agarilyticus TaxID=1232219 RepID=UPI000677AEE9|nr:hypothetical protein [Halococcus agarilyticus]
MSQQASSRSNEHTETVVHGCSYAHPSRPVADLAERPVETTPGDLRQSFFGNENVRRFRAPLATERVQSGRGVEVFRAALTGGAT